MSNISSELGAELHCASYTPNDAGYAAEVSGFNTAIQYTPNVVVAVESAGDIVAAIHWAREHHVRVAVQCTGHGADVPLNGGLLLSTRRLNRLSIDAAAHIATIAAGVRWQAVVNAAAPFGLFPIAGSSVDVGAVGYLLGGGLGPLARSHGFSSDYLESLTVVTGTGELLTASAEQDPDLFWALRGGKYGLGIVTEVRVRLVELATLYGGALVFAEENIEKALRGWIDWLPHADSRVTTSVAIMHLPPLDFIPEPFRGKRLLHLRFAYPGASAEGTELAAPLRALAPLYLDMLGEMPVTEIAKIHNDPSEPGPGWVQGMMLSHIDQAFAAALLRYVGAGSNAPFVSAEIRQLGAATQRDVPGGSAVGGRDALFTFALFGVPDPALFQSVIPNAAAQVTHALSPWISSEDNINFVGVPRVGEPASSPWSPATLTRLEQIRRKYDSEGIL